jgi:hypothetical protein
VKPCEGTLEAPHPIAHGDPATINNGTQGILFFFTDNWVG